MQTEHETLFEVLEPPPGGVERMRAKLAAPAKQRRGFGVAAPFAPLGFAVIGLGAVAVALLALLVMVRPIGPQPPGTSDNAILAAPQFDRLLGRATPPRPLEVQRDGRPVQTEQLPSTDSRVHIYRML
jgi:hypothetical protein